MSFKMPWNFAPSPSQPPPSNVTGGTSDDAGKTRGKRVLIVEDDLSTTNALRQLLNASGYSVVVVSTVAAAMACVDDTFDSVVLDLMLPDGDGADVLQWIRNKGLRARVCVTTGVSSPAWLMRVTAMGANAVLQKPIDIGDLLDIL